MGCTLPMECVIKSQGFNGKFNFNNYDYLNDLQTKYTPQQNSNSIFCINRKIWPNICMKHQIAKTILKQKDAELTLTWYQNLI